jgi:hypothetical protein
MSYKWTNPNISEENILKDTAESFRDLAQKGKEGVKICTQILDHYLAPPISVNKKDLAELK